MEDLVKKKCPNNNSKSFVTRNKIKSSVKKLTKLYNKQ